MFFNHTFVYIISRKRRYYLSHFKIVLCNAYERLEPAF